MILALGGSPAAAGAPFHSNERFDLATFPFVDPCTGETFLGSGTIHQVVTQSGTAGSTRFQVHINGVVVGLGDLGTEFRVIQVANTHGRTGDPFPLDVHSVQIVQVIGQGSTPDFHFHLVLHIGFDAEGNLTTLTVKQTATCDH